MIARSNAISFSNDSQRAMNRSGNEVINLRSQHIDVTYHFVPDVDSRGEDHLDCKSTSKMVTDTLPEPLKCVRFKRAMTSAALQRNGEINPN